MNKSLQKLSTQKNELVENSLNLKLQYNEIRNCIIWGILNAIIFGFLFYDICNKCSYSFSNWYYFEYVGIVITSVNVLAYIFKLIYYISSRQQLKGSIAQRNLLKFDDADKSFLVVKPEKSKDMPKSPTAFNATLLSSHSSFFNESGRSRARSTPDRSSFINSSWNSSIDNSFLNLSGPSRSKFISPYSKYLKENEAMVNDMELETYLKNYPQACDRNDSSNMGQNMFHHSSLNSFWFYCNSAASLLKTSLYQLAPSSSKIINQLNKDENRLNFVYDTNSDLIRKIPSARLSKYVSNLRRWISITILHRLESKINHTNQAFLLCGISELQIGAVGLERIKKAVENQQFLNPSLSFLPLILPFLEISTNQEYLVQRIRVLAKGSCISNFQWISEQKFQGLKWDNNVPTDSSILFHLFCTYLDANLLPLPGQKPFFDRYVLVGDIKTVQDSLKHNPIKNKAKCAILCSNALDPKFNFIVESTIHKCAYDKKNLFHVLIQFLYYIKTNQDGILEGVNLGKSGINILCIFDD